MSKPTPAARTAAQSNKAVAPAEMHRRSLVVTMADRYGVESDKLLATLKATAFRPGKDKDGHVQEITNEQLIMMLMVANEYRLNPFLREIYAFVDRRTGGIIPVIGVDGWVRMINEHPALRSYTFREADTFADDGERIPEWIECTINRKDRDEPMVIRERFAECVRDTDPWKTHPARMLRHKALIQCARYAFGFGGIHDPDEAERILEGREIRNVTPPRPMLPPQATEPDKPARATTDQLFAIQEAIAKRCEKQSDAAARNLAHDELLGELLGEFHLTTLGELPFDQVPEVLAWLRAQ